MRNKKSLLPGGMTLIRSSRHSMSIEVKSAEEVIVRAPTSTPMQDIEKFVSVHLEWIEKAKKRATAREKRFPDLSSEELERLKDDALAYLTQRTEYYSRLTSLYPKKVLISVAKKRFGSCSYDNVVRYSAYLMYYPAEAIDYVVLHELAHIKQKNHQKSFYSLIEKYMPDYKKRIKILKS